MHKFLDRGLLALAFGCMTWALGASVAHAASLEACGNIDIRGDAECELIVEGGCEAQCTPPRLRAACAAELYVDCGAECDAEFEAECVGSCEADCSAACEVDPGEFDCSAYCDAQCEADCDAACAGEDNEARCEASCRATCEGTCDASCEGTPPSASCEARCEASCEGTCRAEANLDCQADCQADGFVDCTAELEGGCRAQCESPDGALFCDGQFIDTSDVDACIKALRERLDIEVEGSADAECEGNTCVAEAEGSATCSVFPGRLGPVPVERGAGPALLLFGVGAIGLRFRSRRRRRSAGRARNR